MSETEPTYCSRNHDLVQRLLTRIADRIVEREKACVSEADRRAFHSAPYMVQITILKEALGGFYYEATYKKVNQSGAEIPNLFSPQSLSSEFFGGRVMRRHTTPFPTTQFYSFCPAYSPYDLSVLCLPTDRVRELASSKEFFDHYFQDS